MCLCFITFNDIVSYISVFQRIARNKNDPSHWFDYGTFCLYINDITKVGHRKFGCKIVTVFLCIYFNICQKNALIEMVLLSTHNICFWLRNKKNSFYLSTLI